MIKSVIQVLPTSDFQVFVYFNDGKIKLYDMSKIVTGGIFQKVSNIDDFIDKCTVLNGTLAWDIAGGFDMYNCIDIDADTIYLDGDDVLDPLSQSA